MEMTIGEVADIAEVATSTLRYYEDIGLITPHRRINGRRRYLPAILSVLAFIQLAKDANFTLDEIKELIHDFPTDMPISERWQQIANRKIEEIDQIIRDAQSTKALLEESLDCTYLHFELDADLNFSENP
jgi:MerR family transcriptional regulator, redox-sensitive transcriptional activator SoxR